MSKAAKQQPKAQHGGYREGSGRPKKFGEASTTVSVRVPVSKAKEVKDLIKKFINSTE